MAQKQTAAGPTCVGIIMDGNRRYARARGLPETAGHEAGYRKLREVIGWAHEAGVRTLIVYGFSTENWRRSELEVTALITLLRRACAEAPALARKNNLRIRFIGNRNRFPEDLQEQMRVVETTTAEYAVGTLVLALSYGGRDEIVRAAARLTARGIPSPTEADFASALDTANLPDPDMIIRTGGAQRLSNFLLWQAAYSELFFTDTFWPDFSRAEFDEMLSTFAKRERRGGV